jgi:LPS export ABC transporter permease LptG
VTTASGAAVWKNVFLADISTPGAPKITIASQALVSSGGPNTIRLHLVNGETHESSARSADEYNISTFTETDTTITLPPVPKPSQDLVPLAQQSTRNLLTQGRGPDKEKARPYWIEFNRRFALPAACLVLVMIGIPLGLASRKGGKGAGFVLALVLVFIYYFLYIAGLSMAKGGRVAPAVGVWMGNAIFALVGTLLLWRTDKLPIELGLGQAISSRLKNWRQARAKERESERANGKHRKRVFSRRFPLLLDDYVLRNFTGYLLLMLGSLVVLFLIFTYFELLSDIVRKKISLLTQIEYLINYTPSVLYLITPLAVLLTVLVTFGIMQKSNEITAMKASGVSIYRTVVPILAIALALAGGLFLLDQWYLPTANRRVETLKNMIKGKPAQTYLRPDRKWIFGESRKVHGQEPNRKIYYYEFYDAERNQFGNVTAFELDPHSFRIAQRVYASRAHWSDEQRWVFEKGWQRTFRGEEIGNFRKFEVDTFAELNEPPSYFKKELHQFQEMNYQELSRYIRDLQQSGFDVVRLRVQLQKKIAYPLITLVMAVLAVPFALSGSRRGALTGVATALIIALVAYLTSGLFEALGNFSQLPPTIAAWLPDVIFGLAGGYMILKTPS